MQVGIRASQHDCVRGSPAGDVVGVPVQVLGSTPSILDWCRSRVVQVKFLFNLKAIVLHLMDGKWDGAHKM